MARKILAILILIVPALTAQQPSSPATDDHQLVMQLVQRVSDLEAEIRTLKAGAAPPSNMPPAPSAPSPAVQALLPPASTASPASRMNSAMGDMPNMILPDVPGLQFRGFGDIGFTDSTMKGAHSTFTEGSGLNLFMTSRLSDRFSVLAELLFEFAPTNSIGTDLERLEFHYTPSDFFNLTAGRFHSSIGYYNTAYHHANWLIPTASRPFLFAFEDQGGPLPTHNVGLSATGAIPSGPLGLHYVAEFGNGRTSHSYSQGTAEQVQTVVDENSRKSYNVALFARPAALPGFQTGVSVYQDRLYPTGLPRLAEGIFDAYATYHPSGFEFTAEALEIRHALIGSNIVFHTPGFYGLVSKDVGRGVKPYFSWEYINASRHEPLFGSAIGLRHGPSAGLRYDFSDFAAFKLEYYRLMRRGLLDVNGVRADIAFTF